MDPKHASRYLVLEKAYRRVSKLAAAAKNPRPANYYDRRVIEVQVSDVCEDGGEAVADLEMPLDLGKRLFPIMLDILGDALAEIGANPPRSAAQHRRRL